MATTTVVPGVDRLRITTGSPDDDVLTGADADTLLDTLVARGAMQDDARRPRLAAPSSAASGRPLIITAGTVALAVFPATMVGAHVRAGPPTPGDFLKDASN